MLPAIAAATASHRLRCVTLASISARRWVPLPGRGGAVPALRGCASEAPKPKAKAKARGRPKAEARELAPDALPKAKARARPKAAPTPEPTAEAAAEAQPSGQFRREARLLGITIVTDTASAQRALAVLRAQRDRPHAWDTETADVLLGNGAKGQSPVNHGRVLCATCYCGEDVDFGSGPRLLVDNSGLAEGLLEVFREYFEDDSYKKVFHNYSFERHLFRRHGIRVQGYLADTMHMARLYDTSLANWEGHAMAKIAQKRDAPAAEVPAAQAVPTQRKSVLGVRLGSMSLSARSHLHTMSTPAGAPSVWTELPVGGPPPAAERGYKLKALATHFGLADGQEAKHFAQLWGRKADSAMHAYDSSVLFPQFADYATKDAVLTYKLFEHLKAVLHKRPWHSEVHEVPIGDVLRNKSVAQKLLAGRSRSRISEQHATGGSMWDLFSVYLKDLGECLADLEEIGVGVDIDRLNAAEAQALADVDTYRASFVHSVAGVQDGTGSTLNPDARLINPSSPLQIRTLLFGGVENANDSQKQLESAREFPAPKGEVAPDKPKQKRFTLRSVGLAPSSKTKDISRDSGWPKVSCDVLRRLSDDMSKESAVRMRGLGEENVKHMSAGLQQLAQLSQTQRIIANFLKPLQHHAAATGRIHAAWKFDTSTGRLACSAPNLQNLPQFAQDKYKIRDLFVPAPGKAYVIADYAQLELCVLAHVAKCPRMIQALGRGGDYHSEVAAEMFPHVHEAVKAGRAVLNGKDPARIKPDGSKLPTVKDMFPMERTQAKAINFGIIYGKTPASLAEDLSISRDEAAELVRAWFKSKPGVERWIEKCKREGYEHQRVISLLGRWRTMPLLSRSKDIEPRLRYKSERAAVNFCIQGSAADVVTGSMLQLWRDEELRSLGFRLVMQVHDEFVLEGPKDSAEAAKLRTVEIMRRPFGKTNPKFEFKVPLNIDAAVANSLAGKP